MKKLRMLKKILVRTKAHTILLGYLIFILCAALIIQIFESGISTYTDALWYCYAVISTTGFGDVLVTSFVAKVISVLLTAYSLIVIAIVTGVVVNFYNQIIELQHKDSVANFVDKLENLDKLSLEELREISDKAKKFNDNVMK